MEKEKIDLWMRMYEEQVRHARHHESLRSQSTNLIVAISAAVIAFVGSEGVSQTSVPFLGGFLIAINVYGLLMSLKHYERSRLHVTVGSKYRDVVSAQTSISNETINLAREYGRKEHSSKFKTIRALRAYLMWCGLHLILSLFGLSFIF